MLTKEPMMHMFMIWVEVIDHDVGITRMTCGKDDNLEFGREGFEEFCSSRPNIDASLNRFPIGKWNRQLNLMAHFQIFVAVNESFIEIENECLLIYI